MQPYWEIFSSEVKLGEIANLTQKWGVTGLPICSLHLHFPCSTTGGISRKAVHAESLFSSIVATNGATARHLSEIFTSIYTIFTVLRSLFTVIKLPTIVCSHAGYNMAPSAHVTTWTNQRVGHCQRLVVQTILNIRLWHSPALQIDKVSRKIDLKFFVPGSP